jgi:flagellar biosynthetic protein FliO
MTALLLLQQAAEPAWPAAEGLSAMRGLVSVAVVIGLLGLFVWVVRRGTFGVAPGRRSTTASVEATLPLGERRSLVVVTVEGRRLVLGLTPVQVSLLTELGPRPPGFDVALQARLDRSQEKVQ